MLQNLPALTSEDIEEMEEFPGFEEQEVEEQIVDQATAARTIAELEAEIETLKRLERMALKLRQSGRDKKWEELSRLLQGGSGIKASDQVFDSQGHRRKLVIFTEHKDTLKYLTERITGLLGREDAVVTITGGMGREERARSTGTFYP